MSQSEVISLLLSERAVWEWDGHIHVLGGPTSGHWGHSGGRGGTGRRGGSTARSGIRTIGTMTNKQYDDLLQEIDGWEGARKNIAKDAVFEADELGLAIVTMRDDGELVGIASIGDGMLSMEFGTDYKEIAYFATKRRGYGRKTLQTIARKLSKEDSGLVLASTSNAVPFYKAVGMRRSDIGFGNTFYWTPQDLKEI